MWEGIEYGGGRLRLPRLSSCIDERYRFHERWIGALTRLDVPTHVLWGRRDPIAVEPIAAQLAAEIPHARLTWLSEPMDLRARRCCRASSAALNSPGRPTRSCPRARSRRRDDLALTLTREAA